MIKKNGKVALVTGVNGQDGSYLAEFLLEKGYEVWGTIKRNSVSETQTSRIDHIMDRLHLEYGDMTDMSSLLKVLTKAKPDEIYNLAAQSHVRVSFDQPIYTAQATGLGVLNLLEAIRIACPEAKMYQASSSEMFGNNIDGDGFQRETTPLNPVSPYGCFPPETSILFFDKSVNKVGENTVLGRVKNKDIKDIKVGDEVLSYNTETGIKEYKKVISTMDRDSSELYLIEFSNGNFIECTEEHPIYVHGKEWVEAKNLVIGDKCVQYKYSGLNSRCRLNKTYNEVYGEKTAKEYKDTEEELILKYKENGYECLVIWENDLFNESKKTEKRILDFIYNENSEVVDVIGIEKICKPSKVYNFEVEDNNNYYAYGILVHNCAKVYAYNICRNYRNSYGMFVSNGILFNHESPRRGINFVTNKVVKVAVEISLGMTDDLILGNLKATRDWGHAKDYVKAMWLILQQDNPDDFVCATGISHSVLDLVEYVFERLGLDYEDHIHCDTKFFRPEELKDLKGDATKARVILNWEPEYTFESMLDEMIDYWVDYYNGKN